MADMEIVESPTLVSLTPTAAAKVKDVQARVVTRENFDPATRKTTELSAFPLKPARNRPYLEARIDLGSDRLKMLKANNVLYDKDDNGEYFQLYTESFKDLFFVEIVQRRGYKGFGAINAPIRLNAQSRLASSARIL